MKYIKDNYYSITQNYYDDILTYVWKCSENNKQHYSHRLYAYKYKPKDSNYARNSSHGWKNSKIASLEEIHWLDCCIVANNFITKEEAMLSYINPSKRSIESDPELEQILIKLLT
jgi:hypothetical protein